MNASLLYDCLFKDAKPDAGGKDFLESLNPGSVKKSRLMAAAVTGTLA